MKRLLLFSIFCFVNFSLISQGLSLDDDFYENTNRVSLYTGEKGLEEEVKKKKKFSLKHYCPEPQDQGETNSCVGWAIGYAARSIHQAIDYKWKGQKKLITDNATSAMFIYNQLSRKTGAYCRQTNISLALAKLKETGTIASKDFDTDRNDCTRKPTPEELEQAKKFKIDDFKAIYARSSNKHFIELETKLTLYKEKKPIIVGMRVGADIKSIRDTNSVWNPNYGEDDKLYGHAMVVIGYDDEKGAFELMNSWGKDWGDNGFFWIKYEDFAKYCKYAYKMSTSGELEDTRYSGEISMNKFLNYLQQEDELVFEKNGKFKTVFRDGYYIPKTQVTTEDTFQFYSGEFVEKSYLYVFSIDTRGSINIHYPINEGTDNIAVEHHAIAQIVEHRNLEMNLPKDSAIRFSKKGTEYLIFLNSKEPILDINERIQDLYDSAQEPLEALYDTFGTRLQARRYMNYEKQSIRFENELRDGASIIPIVLKLEIRE